MRNPKNTTFPSCFNLEYVKRLQKPICSFCLVHCRCRGYFVLALNIIVVITFCEHQVLKKAIKRKDYIVIKDIPYKNGNECQKLLC